MNENLTDKHHTIQAHYIDEILQYVTWFSRGIQPSHAELDCFNNGMTIETFNQYKQNYNSSDTVVVEISSIKISQHHNLYYNLLNGKSKEVMEESYLRTRGIRLVKAIHPKRLILVCHASIYMRDAGFSMNRFITSNVIRYLAKRFKCLFVDPSQITSYYGADRCMLKKDDGTVDTNHYSEFMNIELAKLLRQVLSEFEQTGDTLQ